MIAAKQTEGVNAYLALVVGIVAIAWSVIFVRWAPIPGPVSAFYRVLLGSLVFWPYLLLRRRNSLRMSRRSLGYALLGGFFFAGDLACYNTAVLHTRAANAVLLGNNAPVVVGLLSWALFREAPRLRFWIGLLVATSGSLLIVGSDAWRGLHEASGADLLALGASAFFAAYLMVTERVRNSVESAALLGVSLLASTVSLLVFNLAMQMSFAVPSWQVWAAIAGMGIVSQVIGYFSLTYALGHLPVAATSVTLLAQAPLAALLAFLLLGERFGWMQALGALLVLAGVWLVNRKQREETRMLVGE